MPHSHGDDGNVEISPIDVDNDAGHDEDEDDEVADILHGDLFSVKKK